VKICLIGHFTNRPDEGVRNLTHYLGRELAKRYQVSTLSISDPLIWKKVWAFRPHILHYVISPGTPGLAVSRFLSLLNPASKTVLSAPHPAGLSWGPWLKLMKPSLTLVQSVASENKFRSWGYRTHFLPNGVDTLRFLPASEGEKRSLRQKYKIPEDKFVILHMASMVKGRKLEVFRTLQSAPQNQVIIIGRESESRHEVLRQELEDSGCLVRVEYFPDIEEIYALSDCYVFPTVDSRFCIETPLSVLEAMSCNLPVISTAFGALPRLFNEGDGFIYARQESDFPQAIEIIKKANTPVNTREMVLPYSWERVADQLEEIYTGIYMQRH
jgi:glycosyltransferase involved in cell wall biosynthesis